MMLIASRRSFILVTKCCYLNKTCNHFLNVQQKSPKLKHSGFERCFSFFARITNAVRSIVNSDDHIDPKKKLERQYLYYALLLTHWRDARIRYHKNNRLQQTLLSTERDNDVRKGSNNEMAEMLYENVVNELDKNHKIDRKRNVELRWFLQDQFHPQIQRIFEIFHEVDTNLHVTDMILDNEEVYSKVDHSDISFSVVQTTNVTQLVKANENLYKNILIEEYEQTRIKLDQTLIEGRNDLKPNLAFFVRKLSALHILLEHHQWLLSSHNSQRNIHQDEKLLSTAKWNSKLDAFGMDLSTITSSKATVDKMRSYQTLNLCRSASIKKNLGYSIITLQSSIPDSGRGTFVDGGDGDDPNKLCYAGSVLAFQPGVVWPKESLMSDSPHLSRHFEHDPDCLVSLRFDDYVIDSRQSPVTILVQQPDVDSFNNNPFALGHMVNHPPESYSPNALSCMLNYSSPDKKSSLDHTIMKRYLPNQYSNEPGWKTRYFESTYESTIMMHGMCLIATKDMCNEEFMYDYKLQQEPQYYPIWYKPVRYPDNTYFGRQTGRGADDNAPDESPVVFFREDVKKQRVSLRKGSS